MWGSYVLVCCDLCSDVPLCSANGSRGLQYVPGDLGLVPRPIPGRVPAASHSKVSRATPVSAYLEQGATYAAYLQTAYVRSG